MGEPLLGNRKRHTSGRLRLLLCISTIARRRCTPHHLRSHGLLFRRQPRKTHTHPSPRNSDARGDHRRRTRKTRNGHHPTGCHIPKRKLRFTSKVSREFSLGILLIIL